MPTETKAPAATATQTVPAVASIVEFEPKNMNQALVVARHLASSSLIPTKLQGKPGDVLVILMTGHELGLSPMQSLRGINVIEGKPAISASLKVGLVVKHKDICEYFMQVESTPEKATFETKRIGHPKPTTLTYTLKEAQAAGLTGKDNWRKYQAAMLVRRCSSMLAETVYPDLVFNVYDPDEIEDIHGTSEPRDVTPASIVGDLGASSAATPPVTEAPAVEDAEFTQAETPEPGALNEVPPLEEEKPEQAWLDRISAAATAEALGEVGQAMRGAPKAVRDAVRAAYAARGAEFKK